MRRRELVTGGTSVVFVVHNFYNSRLSVETSYIREAMVGDSEIFSHWVTFI